MDLKEELSLSELVKDSINHLVNDLGRDSDAEDFADDVITDIENNYDVDVDFSDPLKYKNWASEVACEVSRQLNEAVRGKDLNEDKQELLRSMAYEDVEYDQVFDKEDFDAFREMMADQGYDITEQDLEDYYEYVKEAQTELNYKDASEDELRKMGAFDNLNLEESAETKICVICNLEYAGYGNNAEPVAKGYCCDKCNMEKVIPARLSQAKGLKESNDTMEQTFQQFKEDVANDNIGGQFGYDWYEDMVNDAYSNALSEYEDVELEPSIQAGRGGIFAYIDGHDCGYVKDFEDECEELYELACESDTYEEFQEYVQSYVARLIEDAREQLPDEDDEEEYFEEALLKDGSGEVETFTITLRKDGKYVAESDVTLSEFVADTLEQLVKKVEDDINYTLDTDMKVDSIKKYINAKNKSKLGTIVATYKYNDPENWNINESLDTARAKAQELRKHSDADVIFYAYRDKKGNLVELQPEELTMDQYKERREKIKNAMTKYSDVDPRGNRYGHQKDIMFYALYKGAVTESMEDLVGPFQVMFGDDEDTWDGGEFDTFEEAKEVALGLDGGYATGYQIYDADGEIVEESLNESLESDKDAYIRSVAEGDFEVGKPFDPDDFSYFKRICKEDGYIVTEADFDKYFEYLDDIRSEQYDLDEAILTDKDKFEREIEQLDIKATNFEKLSKESFDKGNEEGGHYYKELADEIRREIDMKLATRSHSMKESMNGEYVVMGVTTAGNKVYYNADTREWMDKADDATIFTDMDIARDTWSVVTNNGRKLPDGFRRIFVPNYNKQTMNEDWNIGSNKVVPFGSDEHLKLMDLAQKLEDNSPNGYKYEVRQTYEDFGANMQWTTIICSDRKGDTWQVLNTKEWLDLANGSKSVEEVYTEVVNGKYFQDKQKGYDDMNLGELFDDLD